MNKIIFILTLSAFLFTQQAEVTNIQAAQRRDGSQIVDITYDLSEDAIFEFFEVTVEVSLNGGNSWTGMNNVSGDMGEIIEAGNGKILTWNYGQQFNETYSDQVKIRINAIATTVIIDDSQEIPFEMITIPSGDYTYGENDAIQTIDYDYEIMKYEVTDYDYVIYLQQTHNEVPSGIITCSDCEFDYSSYGSECCDSAWDEYGINCTQLEANYDWDCSGCTCPGGDAGMWWDGAGVWGAYPGDAHYPAGYYQFMDFSKSRISFNGEIFEVEEGFVNHPATGITWFGAWAFATYYGMELPDKYQWEKAARGNTGYDYPWGNEISGQNANFNDSDDPFEAGTTPVGSYNGGIIIGGTEDSFCGDGFCNWLDEDEDTCPADCNPNNCGNGYVLDCADQDCCPESWIGDGFVDCEDQLYGCDLSCYDNDGGDCDGRTNSGLDQANERHPKKINKYLNAYNTHNFRGRDFQTIDSPSPFGVYDMSGNVREWLYKTSQDQTRLTKGGGYLNNYTLLKSWLEYSNELPESSNSDLGFRCIRVINE